MLLYFIEAFCLTHASLWSFSHSAVEEAETTVQGDRGGQATQAAESPERSESFFLRRPLPVSGCCSLFQLTGSLAFRAPPAPVVRLHLVLLVILTQQSQETRIHTLSPDS